MEQQPPRNKQPDGDEGWSDMLQYKPAHDHDPHFSHDPQAGVYQSWKPDNTFPESFAGRPVVIAELPPEYVESSQEAQEGDPR